MLSLNTVMIGSEDPETLSAFYAKVLGEPGFNDGSYVGWQAGASMLVIGPHSEVKGTNDTPGRIILNFETAEFEAEVERTKGVGAAVEKEPYRPGEEEGDFWLVTFRDPDGNLFQLATPMSAS